MCGGVWVWVCGVGGGVCVGGRGVCVRCVRPGFQSEDQPQNSKYKLEGYRLY